MERRVFTILAALDDGTVEPYFCIHHEGALWLVPEWLIDPSAGEATPIRMIRVDTFQKADSDRYHYVAPQLRRAVIEGRESGGPEVRSLPSSPRVARAELYDLPTPPYL